MNDFFLRLSAAYILFHFIRKRAECFKYNLSTKTFCISMVNRGLLKISKKGRDISEIIPTTVALLAALPHRFH